MNTSAMIYARLTGDESLVAMLACFVGGPAVFGDRAPDGFVIGQSRQPCVVIGAATEDASDDTFTEGRRAVTQDVRLYVGDFGSSADLDSAARTVRALLDGREAQLGVEGGVVVVATVSGPVALTSSDAAVLARRLTLKLLIEETE